MKLLTLERAFWLIAIIALLITLRHCGNKGADTVKLLTDSLRIAEKAASDTQALQQFRYGLDSARFAQAAQHARDSAGKAWADVGSLQRQIRALAGRKTTSWVVQSDYVDTPFQCCLLATALADQVDTLKVREAEKDRAANDQLTLAANMVNAQAKLLDEAHGRFNLLDSVYQEREAAGRPRGSVWGGVETQVGPVSSAGLYLKYQTKRGKEYGVGGGRQQFGWYGSVQVGLRLFGGPRR